MSDILVNYKDKPDYIVLQIYRDQRHRFIYALYYHLFFSNPKCKCFREI